MTTLLVLFAVVAFAVVALTPRLGTRVFAVAAIAPTAAFVQALLASPGVLAERPLTESIPWIPSLGVGIDLRMDALSWVLVLVVTGVGAVVMLYCIAYFRDDEPSLGRFAGVLTAFAGSMYGLVLADDTYLLFVFWEATSVLSYLLIGHATDRRASRGAALQALLVTTFGGLAMLGGLVVLQAATGTALISRMVADPPPAHDPRVIAAVALVLVGAITKSAVQPFSFWLPGAMAAPTPVSAYLHAAAMVKAGIYLIARLALAFAAVPGWRESLILLGVITMLMGGWRALREHDLKLVLAGGTVAQLGFLAIVASLGTRGAGLAAVVLLTAHALFKSTLFLVAGVVDHAAGTRDLRRLSGLGRRLPVLAVVAVLAACSMAGLPPFLGFVAKEAVLAALVGTADPLTVVALVGIVAGSMLTVAYAARFLWGAFATKPGIAASAVHTEGPGLVLPPAVLAVSGLLLGPLAPLVEQPAARYAAALPGHAEHLALWHGATVELLLSAVTIAGGLALFVLRGPFARAQSAIHPSWDAEDGYRAVLRGTDRAATRLTALIQRGSLPFYLAVILCVFVAGTSATLVFGAAAGTLRLPALFVTPAQTVVAALMSVAAVAAAVAGKRFQAVVLTGLTGFGMALLFALQGAPDLALTQVLVDLATLIAFVLVLRRLPARLGVAHGSSRRLLRALLGAAVGVVMCVIVLSALAARTGTPISTAFAELAVTGGHGTNVVNVVLVDLRGWDTLGEVTVLISAATGVASLLFVSGRGERLLGRGRQRRQRLRQERDAGARGRWLVAGPTLRTVERSVLLEVGVRLVFPALMVVSVYLLVAGHNAPGGGFAGGLVAGLAFTARYLAAGRHELAAAAPVNAGVLLGVGLLLATGTALVPLFAGGDALTSGHLDLHLGRFGDLSLVSSTVFDIGVYLIVVGVVLDVLRSLGGEIDRHAEQPAVREPA